MKTSCYFVPPPRAEGYEQYGTEWPDEMRDAEEDERAKWDEL